MKKREINVVLKILTHTNVVVLTMLVEVGVSMNYFSQNSQNICSKIQWNLADLFFFLQCYENLYVYKTKQHTFNLLVSKTSPKCINEHLLFSLKIDLFVLTKCSFGFVLSSASLFS